MAVLKTNVYIIVFNYIKKKTVKQPTSFECIDIC